MSVGVRLPMFVEARRRLTQIRLPTRRLRQCRIRLPMRRLRQCRPRIRRRQIRLPMRRLRQCRLRIRQCGRRLRCRLRLRFLCRLRPLLLGRSGQSRKRRQPEQRVPLYGNGCHLVARSVRPWTRCQIVYQSHTLCRPVPTSKKSRLI